MDDISGDYGVTEEPAFEAPPVFGDQDERRLHVRAYNHWASLLGGREFPAPGDLDGDRAAFGGSSIVLDFAAGRDHPQLRSIGDRLRDECGLEKDQMSLGAVPPRSLISRLTDHYMEIIANRAPVGFEAEFISRRGNNTLYRGILMPLSSDGKTIDCMYGVINWKELLHSDDTVALTIEAGLIDTAAPADELEALMFGAAQPGRPILVPDNITAAEWRERAASAFLGEGGPHAPSEAGATEAGDARAFGRAAAGLEDHLTAARQAATAASSAGERSRSALYEALGRAYDFHLESAAAPMDYAALLKQAGLKQQARAPMTPVAKLVFGADYDKGRLTEFAAGLSFAARQEVPAGGFQRFVTEAEGGLKALVKAERAARRSGDRPASADAVAARLSALRSAAPAAQLDLDVPGEDEFVLLVARREPGGGLGVMGAVPKDQTLLGRALSRLD